MRNILGDRAIEWAFIEEYLPNGPGNCLDFGPGGSKLATRAVERSLDVTALDLDVSDWHDQPGVMFMHSDLFAANLPGNRFDVIINCSTIEHVGVPGRYGVIMGRLNADLDAMVILRYLLKPGGMMLLTLPVGQDAEFVPMCRVYGARRLPRLLLGFTVEVERCYIKNDANEWIPCSRQTALDEVASCESSDPSGNLYALGCFVLRKPND